MSSGEFDDLFGGGGGSAAPAASAPGAAATAGPQELRKEVRVPIKWPARVLLSDGTVLEARTCDISESGIGIATEAPIGRHASVKISILVPHPDDGTRNRVVIGTMKTAHVTVRGASLVYGGVWLEIDKDGRDLIKRWVRKLRH